jgi:hypothetical protein
MGEKKERKWSHLIVRELKREEFILCYSRNLISILKLEHNTNIRTTNIGQVMNN